MYGAETVTLTIETATLSHLIRNEDLSRKTGEMMSSAFWQHSNGTGRMISHGCEMSNGQNNWIQTAQNRVEWYILGEAHVQQMIQRAA